MAIIGTGTLARALAPGVNKWVGGLYEPYPMEYAEIFKSYNSDKNYEIDVTLGPTGLLQVKPESQAVHYDDFKQGFKKIYTHIVYASGFIITREEIEDNLYSELAQKRAEMLGRSARITKEQIAANVLNRAFTSGYAGADGLELCSTAHLLEKGGTFQNELTTAADLSESSLEQAVIDIGDWVDGANKSIMAKPRKLIVPNELQFEAERILFSVLQNDTANNALNALKSKRILPEGYAVNHFLTDADAFFIMTDVPDGMKHFQRRALEIKNNTDFDSENMKFKISERYVFGWSDPRGIYGSPGA